MLEQTPCRHEYVRIYQRKLKGLDRRMVATRAYLPVGFKLGDFAHLGDGSYCFCTKCRVRLFPRRSQVEKAAARLALAQGKLVPDRELVEELIHSDPLFQVIETAEVEAEQAETEQIDNKDIHVEELELESVDVSDIQAEGVKLADDEVEDDLADEEDL